MNIIYGILPYKYLTDLTGVKGLSGLSYKNLAILDVKFISEMNQGILFSALTTDNHDLDYPDFDFEIINIIINPKKHRTLTEKSRHLLSDNAKKKRSRKEKNLIINKQNWKQFIGRRKTIIDLYISIL
ncbi:hypothetical protein A613_p47 (plasmid) [Photobacterium damselae subsp. piscicida DI21]|nr:hypothetical protein A613_p47 [Photobacterium damselae subsp. piscicida DI21]